MKYGCSRRPEQICRFERMCPAFYYKKNPKASPDTNIGTTLGSGRIITVYYRMSSIEVSRTSLGDIGGIRRQVYFVQYYEFA